MSLCAGWIINQMYAMPLPMPDDVIQWVHRLAHQQKVHPGLLFAD